MTDIDRPQCVISGKLYDTATAEKVASAGKGYLHYRREWVSETTLYRTAEGEWFTCELNYPDDIGPYGDLCRKTFHVLPDLYAAYQWIKENVRILEDLYNPDYFPTMLRPPPTIAEFIRKHRYGA